MRLRPFMLVSAFSLLLAGCAAYTERQFIGDVPISVEIRGAGVAG